MKKIFITGISGTGKTTIYEELIKRNYYAISLDETDDLCYWVNRETKERIHGYFELNRDFTSQHQWICDIEYLKKLINLDKELVFVLGSASNQDQFINLFNKVILLQCKPMVFIERLNTRTNNDFGKHKTVQDHLLTWYKNFENKLIEGGAISINTDKQIGEVVDEVIEQAMF